MKLAAIFGTRPEAIKMAPVVLAMKKYPEYIDPFVIVTAQHREMLDHVLDLFQIRPDFDLNIMTQRQTLFEISIRALQGLGEALGEIKPDLALVHGDTTTTFIGALAAFYRQIEVGHVEAGLRTGNKYSPFPEEINRHLTGSLADLHFAPTSAARENLLKENIAAGNIFITGNTVIDALKATVRDDYEFEHPALRECVTKKARIVLVTAHRRENLGEPLLAIYRALAKIVDGHPDIEVIFPLHKNPAVREPAQAILGAKKRVHLIEPLDYGPFVNLMYRSYMLLSDSGGVQEEAPALGKPVLVLRGNTERPEALRAGTVKLAGTHTDTICRLAHELLADPSAYKEMAEAVNPYGDGLAAERIVRTILFRRAILPQPPEYFRDH
ncbi:MAG: UDP-N-acetylglucosamine 2-epimerase (non-hydrolyzing) [Acidaminococcales bacterium]|nr:UDP-N-acetylglucosamine 2-epimerase (non-hydrolyzing) [Acidaminococcales bacterium]